MAIMSNSQDSLVTSGIVTNIGVPFDTPPGFTIPLVKLRDGANTTYVQRLDRNGRIVGFDPFNGPIKSIPSPSTYPLSVGDREVYSLLDPGGQPHVGTKRELEVPIRKWLAQIKRPLLRMSFARFVGNNEVAAKAAREAITEKSKELRSEWDAVRWFVAGIVGPDVMSIATELGAKHAIDIDTNSSSVSVDDLGEQGQRISVKLHVKENSAPKLNIAKARQLEQLRKYVAGIMMREVQFEVDSNEPREGRRGGNVYIEPRPKGRHEGTPIEDYVIEDHKGYVLKTFHTQKEAIDWAKKEGHYPLVARVRHENNKTKPNHWRSA
jgi:hypothetical protein